MTWAHREPVYWMLFGAGGVVTALLAPALIVAMGLLIPLEVAPSELLAYSRMRALLLHPLASVAVAIGLPLALWHCAHRIYHGLHDLRLPRGPLAWAATYGLAAAGTVLTLAALVALHLP